MTTRPMPNFWWCDTHGLYRGGFGEPCADAVKLGNVEKGFFRGYDQGFVHGVNTLKKEILTVLNEEWPKNEDHHDWTNEQLADIRAIVERKP